MEATAKTAREPYIETYNVFERIQGVITKMARPKANHSVLSGEFYSFLRVPVRKNEWIILLEPNVYLGDDLLHPDLVICTKDKIRKMDVHGAPQVVIEIFSPSTRKRDREVKLKFYLENGVEEVWIVDPRYYGIDIHTEYEKPAVSYALEEADPHNPLTEEEIAEANKRSAVSPTYPFIAVPIGELFEGMDDLY